MGASQRKRRGAPGANRRSKLAKEPREREEKERARSDRECHRGDAQVREHAGCAQAAGPPA
eukprot:2487672-Pyramimonas_sp.AAC.1